MNLQGKRWQGHALTLVVQTDDGKIVGNAGFRAIDTVKNEAEFGIVLDQAECHLLVTSYGFDVPKLAYAMTSPARRGPQCSKRCARA